MASETIFQPPSSANETCVVQSLSYIMMVWILFLLTWVRVGFTSLGVFVDSTRCEKLFCRR